MATSWTQAALITLLAFWYSQGSLSSAVPESGLEKAAAASAVIAGSDASLSGTQNGQGQTDMETRLKRITDTIQRIRGPDTEQSDHHHRGQSERLVVADRAPPGFQGGSPQSPFMMRNDELNSSGDGALGDDDEGDDGNGEFGSGDESFKTSDDPPMGPVLGSGPQRTPILEGVYPADVDEHTTRKPVSTTHRRITNGRVTPSPTRKLYEENPPTSKPRPTGSSTSCRTLPLVWLRLLVCVSISLSLCRRLATGR